MFLAQCHWYRKWFWYIKFRRKKLSLCFYSKRWKTKIKLFLLIQSFKSDSSQKLNFEPQSGKQDIFVEKWQILAQSSRWNYDLKAEKSCFNFEGKRPVLPTDAVISITVEIVALVAVTFVHEIMQIEATLLTWCSLFTLPCNIEIFKNIYYFHT